MDRIDITPIGRSPTVYALLRNFIRVGAKNKNGKLQQIRSGLVQTIEFHGLEKLTEALALTR